MNNILHVFFRFTCIFAMIFCHCRLVYANPDFFNFYHANNHQVVHEDNQLLALESYLNAGKIQKSQVLAGEIQTQTPEQAEKKQLLLAKLYSLEQKPGETIDALAKISSVEHLDLNDQASYHELLATAYQLQNQSALAAQQRMKLEDFLVEQADIQRNRQKMWALMQEMSTEDLNVQLMEAKPGSLWRGWLDFTQMMRGKNMGQEWERWQEAYPNHPAKSMVTRKRSWTSLFTQSKPVFNQIHQVALLLPLTGPLSGPGLAIKQGFMDAFQHSQGQFTVLCYDSAKGALHQYHRAIEEGANLVIGPLTKVDASAVASSLTSTPTLLLNDFGFALSSTKYGFGYAPKDEAKQVADLIRDKGHRRVMMIAPENAWGQEIAAAFRDAAVQQGLEIVANVGYTSATSIAPVIKQALRYSEYSSKTTNGQKTLESSRRQDVDAIFMLAYPSMARQIMPMLKYYYAGDIPVYATSTAYAANYNPSQDKDLDGLYFLDIPWVFNHQLGERAWPETWNTYNRLYALGYDAYGLVQEWQVFQSMPDSGLAKQTGLLFLQSNGHIRRQLVLGQIRQGIAREVNWDQAQR